MDKKSNKPYLLEIKKMKRNTELLKNSEYFKSTKELSPISGYEEKYNPNKWNKKGVKETHNCYSYALGKIIKKLKHKAQPGYASGYNYINNSDYECKKFSQRLKNDSPGSYLEKFDNKCLPGFYKIFLALDINNDYHWYKQNSDGYWSHKPGSTEVTNKDATGKKIKNPYLSDRNFGHRNYYKPCFFACIYSDLTRSINSIYNI